MRTCVRTAHSAKGQRKANRNKSKTARGEKITKRKIRPLTGDEIPAYLNAAAEDRWSYALRLLPFSGLRESELLGLTWDCVDFERNAITIDKQLLKRGKADGGYTLAPTKSDNIRTVVLAPSAMDLLRQRQHQQIEHRLQAGEAWTGWKTPAEQRRALVFTTETGEHLTPNSLYYHAKRILSAIGCGDRDVHDLRHTYATLSLQNGMDIKTLQMSLGHATAAFTLDTYAHVSEQMQQQAAEGMEQYISGLK